MDVGVDRRDDAKIVPFLGILQGSSSRSAGRRGRKELFGSELHPALCLLALLPCYLPLLSIRLSNVYSAVDLHCMIFRYPIHRTERNGACLSVPAKRTRQFRARMFYL